MSTSDELIEALPFARRFARALTGSQAEGDALVVKAIAQRPAELPALLSLYAGVIGQTSAAPQRPQPLELTPLQRQLLLLTSLENISLEDATRVVGLSVAATADALGSAHATLKAAAATDILIIEDETVIAMELQSLVEACGHSVSGIATSEAEAARLAAQRSIGLILADVNLGRGGNGIAATATILKSVRVPVIFVTAYPEKLLTAQGVEPAFVMRKPFDPEALATLIYQALNAERVPLI
jgi:CheY-like chemotaxis protein